MKIEKIKDIYFKNFIFSVETKMSKDGYFEGCILRFKNISQDEIYLTSSNSIVRIFPSEIYEKGIHLSQKEMINLSSALTSIVSTYLYSTRKHFNDGSLTLFVKSENGFKLKLEVTKHFFRDGNLGKTKLKLSISQNDEIFGDIDLISLELTKRDVYIMLESLKEIFSSQISSSTMFVHGYEMHDDKISLEEVNVPIKKHISSLLIGNSWLHGQELFNLMFFVHKLVYGFHIEQTPEVLYFSYGQLSLQFKNNIFYLIVNHNNSFGAKNESFSRIDHIAIPLSAFFLTSLYMLLDLQLLTHFTENDSATDFESQRIFASYNDIKYHISTKESFIGLGYKHQNKKDAEMLTISCVVKDGVFGYEEEDGSYIKDVFKSNGENIPVLTELHLNLRDQWEKFIEALSVTLTKSYLAKKDFYLKKFYIIKKEGPINYKYEFIISASKDNKATAVLTILKKDKDIVVASFRQPLFEKYLFQLLIISLNITNYFNKTKYIIDMPKSDFIKYQYSSLKTVKEISEKLAISYGFERVGNDIRWGVLTGSKLSYNIPYEDIVLLNMSAKNRLIQGKWLPFVGKNIAIGQDGYLTDMFGEINLEKDISHGEQWAANIYYATNMDTITL